VLYRFGVDCERSSSQMHCWHEMDRELVRTLLDSRRDSALASAPRCARESLGARASRPPKRRRRRAEAAKMAALPGALAKAWERGRPARKSGDVEQPPAKAATSKSRGGQDCRAPRCARESLGARASRPQKRRRRGQRVGGRGGNAPNSIALQPGIPLTIAPTNSRRNHTFAQTLCASAALRVSAIRSKQYPQHAARSRRSPEPPRAGSRASLTNHPTRRFTRPAI